MIYSDACIGCKNKSWCADRGPQCAAVKSKFKENEMTQDEETTKTFNLESRMIYLEFIAHQITQEEYVLKLMKLAYELGYSDGRIGRAKRDNFVKED